MRCDHVELAPGEFMIVCGRGRRRPAAPCEVCGKPSTRLCDFPLTDRRKRGARCALHARRRSPRTWTFARCPLECVRAADPLVVWLGNVLVAELAIAIAAERGGIQ